MMRRMDRCGPKAGRLVRRMRGVGLTPRMLGVLTLEPMPGVRAWLYRGRSIPAIVDAIVRAYEIMPPAKRREFVGAMASPERAKPRR